MPDSHFLPTALPTGHSDVFGPLQGGERPLWQGRCAVAEYAFDQAASLPRWALPESTEVLVTDNRVLYAYTRSDSPDDLEVTSGELRWLYPQHLRVQPGARTTGRAAAAAQIQLVCAASDGSFPALVFAGGDLATVGDADKLANLIRQSIARFRVDHADQLSLSTPQSRMLSRLLIGPEFSNFQGGEGQTVTLLGALSVHRPADPGPPAGYELEVAVPEPHRLVMDEADHDSLLLASLHQDFPPRYEPQPAQPQLAPPQPAQPQPYEPRPDETQSQDVPYPPSVSGTRMRLPGHRPGLAADEARALQAAAAEQATHVNQPDLASRAAELAARIANLVSTAEEQAADQAAADRAAADQAAAERVAADQAAAERVAAAERSAAEQAAAERARAEEETDLSEVPTTDLTARAAHVRRAARFTTNSAAGKAGARRPEPEIGSTSRGQRPR
ncbi:translation initiation factor 2 [Actinoplanes sp. NPDC048967]|uniref:translation initiation factor 2 n=1 Tax=Actinoplanes sp. NPDC048967 TaxID=3155269 RepID=UPI0033DD5D69